MQEMNLRNYAYLGDSVWELFSRERTVFMTNNSKELHNLTTTLVNTFSQVALLNHIENLLTPKELEIVKRARNLPIPVGRRGIQHEYRLSTAFETLIGWWFLKDKTRYNEMMKIFEKEIQNIL